MKRLYELNPEIKSGDELLAAYELSNKTDNILQDVCNILFVNPRPYVYGTVRAYVGTMVPVRPYEEVVHYVWRFCTDTGEWSYNFPYKVDGWRDSNVRHMLSKRYYRTLPPDERAESEKSIQRIVQSFKIQKHLAGLKNKN